MIVVDEVEVVGVVDREDAGGAEGAAGEEASKVSRRRDSGFEKSCVSRNSPKRMRGSGYGWKRILPKAI